MLKNSIAFKIIFDTIIPISYQVIDGHLVPNEESLPWMASIFIDGGKACSATIISPKFVLTAGHCLGLFYVANFVTGIYNLTGFGLYNLYAFYLLRRSVVVLMQFFTPSILLTQTFKLSLHDSDST